MYKLITRVIEANGSVNQCIDKFETRQELMKNFLDWSAWAAERAMFRRGITYEAEGLGSKEEIIISATLKDKTAQESITSSLMRLGRNSD